VRALGYVQIDTLHVVNRAHYVTLWSRFGSYSIDDFHKLIYSGSEPVKDQRRLYEGWGHAASIIPLEHYRYHRWRTDPKYSYNPTFRQWLSKNGNRDLVDQTLARIRSEGGLRVGDLEYDGPQRGVWYDWKPPKMALEALFAWGDLMVADRVKFQRVYDVKERVLPEWVDTTTVPPEEARRFCLEQAAKALGVFDLRHLTLYAYMRATPVKSEVKALVTDGTLVEFQGESLKGVKKWMVTCRYFSVLPAAISRWSAPPSLPLSTHSSGRGIGMKRFGASNNYWSATSQPRIVSTATSPSRFCTGTGWWAVSTRS
jgi:uncharacterized protein YcaQ